MPKLTKMAVSLRFVFFCNQCLQYRKPETQNDVMTTYFEFLIY